jgi:phage terminase large subunit
MISAKQKTIKPIPITRVFKRNRAAAEQIIINRGGARSSKSYSIAQLLVERLFTCPGRKILILRKTFPALRISTLITINNIIQDYGISNRMVVEKMNMNYWHGTSLMHFGSLDNLEKIKSSEWNDIWMEEANEFTYDDYVTLKLRLSSPVPDGQKRNQMFISFNPVDEYCWIKQRVLDPASGEDVVEIHSTWHDNPFLSQDYINTIEGLSAQDRNFYRIYALGEWGKLENIIYSNWNVYDDDPVDAELVRGLDFGYNHPTTLIDVRFKDEVLYWKELIYKSGMTNSELINELKRVIPEGDRGKYPIYADHAEPARIEEINAAGFFIMPADKSVKDGIDFCKSKRIMIHRDSVNLQKEIRGYSWRIDKNGIPFDEPVKFNDDGMDGGRYGSYTHWKLYYGGGRPNIHFI